MEPMDLDRRKRFILQAVVQDYVRTAEPVGSRILVERYQLTIKPATVRNEMAEMSDMGYLLQPHTSAGRIPSDLGYRFYVNQLMPEVALVPEQQARASTVRKIMSEDIEEVLRQTCRILSSLTDYTSVAAAPEMEHAGVRQVHLTPVQAHRVLVVVIPDSGLIKHRTLEVSATFTPTSLTFLGNYLSEVLRGRSGEELNDLPALPPGLMPVQEIYHVVIEAIRDLLHPMDEAEMVVEGAAWMVRQPEFKDVERLEELFTALEERRSVLEILQQTSRAEHDVTVVIGKEQPCGQMQTCSLVAARYTAGSGRTGAIGIIGPTRMPYASTVPAVGLVANHLSFLLTSRNLI